MSQKNFDQSWSRSSQKKIDISHVWTIERFRYRKDTIIQSPEFYSEREDKKQEWCITLFPDGYDEDSKGKISLFLTLKFPWDDEELIEVTRVFSLLDESGKCLKQQYWESTNTYGKKTRLYYGLMDFCRRDEILPKLTNYVLKIKCDFSYFSTRKIVSGTGTEDSAQLDEGSSMLSYNFGSLMTNPQFSDVTFCVISGDEEGGTTEFKSHKNILSVRSPYFASILTHDFKEKSVENRVEIRDVKPEIFKEILSYIYTGSTSRNLSENEAKELLVAADRFALGGLKMAVNDLLVSKLDNVNASELLVFAHLNSMEVLKTKAINYLATNLKNVMDAGSWRAMIREHPDFLELILKVALKKLESYEENY